MKKIILATLLAMFTLAFYSFRYAEETFNNIFDQLGIQTEEGESYIADNIIHGSTGYPRTSVMINMALDKREEAVKEIGNYIKAYVQTTAFSEQYETARQDQKPQKPEGLYQNEENMAVYRQDLKRWETEYPARQNDFLKMRLQQFLQQTANIDFTAKLVRQGRKMVFADPQLEQKDPFWKSCFRSGKRTVDAARAFAQQWLTELK
jgi:hypothetical protein